MAGRPKKKGLDWFKKDVNYYGDLRIMDLLEEYGPSGNTVFDCILCRIYREGYFLAMAPADLARIIVKDIGGRWIKKDFVLQVIYYCADIGLLCKDLLLQNIITSVGIQARYAEVTSRNKANKSLHWLIDEDGQPLKTAPTSDISATETPNNATEMPISATDMQQEKEKEEEKEIREREGFAPPSLDEVQAYCSGKNIDAVRFFNYYSGNGWVNSAGIPIADWKPIADNWEKTERTKPDKKVKAATFDLDEIEEADYFSTEGKS